MKKTIFILLVLFSAVFGFGQNAAPKTVTPQTLQQIKSQVDQQAVEYKKTLAPDEWSPNQIEFAVDTFKIEHVVSKQMDQDYSTLGINKALEYRSNEYDKLLTLYYKKLLNALTTEDKNTLQDAQKAWLTFRDAEAKLIRLLSKENYSGGGTMQSNIVNGLYSDMVQNRTIEIFNYFNAMVQSK